MSHNPFQPWKSTNLNYYEKNSNSQQQETTAANLQQEDGGTQFGLERLANFYKINNVGKDIGDEIRRKEDFIESAISNQAKQQIIQILDNIASLKPPEKLLLYLRMPGGSPTTDPLRQPQNPLGTRSEINHTINWVRSHLEHDVNVSIPKQDVYDDYVSYCSLIEIKPLSTADFGKVMKQVFPGIRPRRLGTRGHSRYCYAAMRKATKLEPPKLPDIKTDTGDFNTSFDDESWSTVKTWADGLLNSSFSSLKDLAGHIKKHLNSPANNSSRQLLQKKILQKELKEKKKLTESVSLKKRRKKKRRTSSSSPELSQAESSDFLSKNIKIEVDDTDLSPILPMNLVTDQPGSSNSDLLLQSTNTDCDIINSLVSPATSPNVIIEKKINDSYDEHQNIICKKKRVAQEAKGLWIGGQTTTTTTSMKPPPIPETNFLNDNLNIPMMGNASKRNNSQRVQFNVPFRKKIRFLDMESGSGGGSGGIDEPINLNTSQQVNEKSGLVQTDFMIPRERVISICNLDKDALDDYLNDGDNSQEQEAELLQIFQPDTESDKSNGGEDLGIVQTSIPLLENYQLFSGDNNKLEKKLDINGGQDKISQLRSYLQQNLNNSGMNKINDFDTSVIKSGPNSTGSLSIYSNSASASLAMLSQRHVTSSEISSSNTSNRCVKRKINMATTNYVPQSPNTRRRNYSFVPISAGTQSSNLNQKNIDGNLFVSPRATSIVKRTTNQRSLGGLQSLSCFSLNNRNQEHVIQRDIKTEVSSAPPSPSMIQNFHYTNQTNYQFPSTNISQQIQCTSDNYPMESRSQSVPLHCRTSPAFNNNNNNYEYSGYSSQCSSIAPTPVPSEFNDFTNPLLLDILSDSSNQPVVKIESNFIPSLLDTDSTNSPSVGMTEILPEFNQRLNYNTMSRSVPSTPLPIHGYNNNNTTNSLKSNKIFDIISKSVPTTPNSVQSLNPFRYSPETNRDFLINGNTIEQGKMTSFFNSQQQNQPNSVVEKDLTITEGIDDLSNFDDVSDSILGADLLNNL